MYFSPPILAGDSRNNCNTDTINVCMDIHSWRCHTYTIVTVTCEDATQFGVCAIPTKLIFLLSKNLHSFLTVSKVHCRLTSFIVLITLFLPFSLHLSPFCPSATYCYCGRYSHCLTLVNWFRALNHPLRVPTS